MPMYEYVCRSCDHAFEALVFGDEDVACPQCESEQLERLLSLPGLAQIASTHANGGCGDLNQAPCGAPFCRRQGR
jgi:putative FmdB family regulatory protein